MEHDPSHIHATWDKKKLRLKKKWCFLLHVFASLVRLLKWSIWTLMSRTLVARWKNFNTQEPVFQHNIFHYVNQAPSHPLPGWFVVLFRDVERLHKNKKLETKILGRFLKITSCKLFEPRGFWGKYCNSVFEKTRQCFFLDTAFQWYFKQGMSDMSLFFSFWLHKKNKPYQTWVGFLIPAKKDRTRKKKLEEVFELEKKNRKHHHEHSLQMFNLKNASSLPNKSSWWFQIFVSHPYLQKWSNLTRIFQMGWLDQPEIMAPLQLDAFTWRPRPCGAALPNFHHFGGKRIRPQHGGEPWLPGGGKCVAAPWDWMCEQGGIKVFLGDEKLPSYIWGL